MSLLQTEQEKIMDHINIIKGNTMTEAEKEERAEQIEMQKMENAALVIAGHVNKYISKHAHAQMSDDPAASIFLESMAVSYVVALRSFSLYKDLPQLSRPTWEEFEADAINMIKTVFKKIEPHLGKENLTCQFN